MKISKRILVAFLFISSNSLAQVTNNTNINRWEQQAKNVKIIRDQWGIPHIYGKSDADAVFGLMYAQCEDDFARVEMNYIEKLGRTAELKGADALYADLQMRMLIDSADAVKDYNKSPLWLKILLDAFADGINFYLYKNNTVKPALLTNFKPWYPLLWTDGSIGAINTAGITETEFKNFYSGNTHAFLKPAFEEPIPTGSNGFAFAPSISASGNAMLYINPHVTFYFRPEVHVISEEGLNVYGAVTWGQFFVYQGFNEFCGWMHTSSNADVADLYEEDVQNNSYSYDHELKPIVQKPYQLFYSSNAGLQKKSFTGYFTHHGPVLTSRNNKWLTLKASNRSLKSIIQSWQRTKARSFNDYKKSMELGANTSNNTVYTDAAGNIAYWHGNFMPKRDTAYNWNKPVDGRTSKTEWKGMHKIEDLVYTINPPNGWLQNCNSTPFTVAGKNSPDRKRYPTYMAPDAENFRGLNAVNVLSRKNKYTIEDVIKVGYDKHLTAFDSLLPGLINAYHRNTKFSTDTALSTAINLLEKWDKNVDENSIALTLAIHWAEKILPSIMKMPKPKLYSGLVEQTSTFIAHATPDQLMQPMQLVLEELTMRYGKWNVTWGSINRFQRITNERDLQFDDARKSFPVAFVSSTWGMLPSYSSKVFPGTKYRYGVNGNSFIAVVEFGKRIKAKSLLAGGENGQPGSKHFFDQGNMYAEGKFKDVLFYKNDVMKNMVRSYHPGE